MNELDGTHADGLDSMRRKRMGCAIEEMANRLRGYAAAHRLLYGSPLGEDGVLGHGAQLILRGLEELLNGELGNKDGRTLSRLLLDIGKEAALLDDNGEI